MTLMEQFADPKLVGSLSFGDKMIGSTITMIMGMGITFAILIIIWIFISIMGKCLGISERKKSTPAVAAAAAPAAAPAEVVSNDGLVVVVAAAVAAYQGANASNLVVKKITRISGESTPWGVSGLEDRLETRKW